MLPHRMVLHLIRLWRDISSMVAKGTRIEIPKKTKYYLTDIVNIHDKV